MPKPSLVRQHRWHGIETVTATFSVETETFTFEGLPGWYRPKKVEGYVWDVGGSPRPELITLPDIRPDATLEPQNPSFAIAGHLIAVSLTGSNEPENLTPVSKGTNDLQQAVETAIRRLAQAPRFLTVEVIDYYVDDPRVPKTFLYTLRDRPGGTVLLNERVAQPWLQVGPMGTPPRLANLFGQATTAIKFLGWRIENVSSSANGARDLRFLAGHLPPAEQRVYAPLEWVLVEKKGYGFIDEAAALKYVQEIGLGLSFSKAVRSLILRSNPILHGDFLSSDVYGKREATIETSSGVVFESHGSLFHGGGFNAPQIDHIIPESLSGPNCVSNAQVTSMQYNTSKQDTTKQFVYRSQEWKNEMLAKLQSDPKLKPFL